MAEDFRVEVELDDEKYGYSLWERLRALHLDDEVRKRLGKKVVVTRDGSELFAYATTARQAREVERIVREVVDADALSAEISVTRWHPDEEDWIDISVPLPQTEAEREAEREALEQAEADEAAREGEFDWTVVVHTAHRDEAATLARRLQDEGSSVARRWRYVVIGAVTEEDAEGLAERLRSELGEGADVSIEANVSDVPGRPFQFIGL